MRGKLLVPSVLCLVAVAASPARAADAPAWHTAFPATEGSPTEGVSCGTDTFCMIKPAGGTATTRKLKLQLP